MNISQNLYLVENQKKNSLIKSLMKDDDFVENITTKNLSEYLEITQNYDNKDELIYKVLEIISQEISNLKFYKSVEGSIAFAKELLEVLKVLQSQQKDISSYPIDSDSDYDIKLLLHKMSELRTYEKALIDCLDKEIDQNYSVFQYYTTHPLEKTIIKKFDNFIEVGTTDNIQLIKTENLLDEIEWVAQDIINKKLPLSDVRVSIDNNSFPIVKMIFNKYQLINSTNNSAFLINVLKLANKLYFDGLDSQSIIALCYYILKDKSKVSSLSYYLINLKYPVNKLFDPLEMLEEKYFNNAEDARIELIEIITSLLKISSENFQIYTKDLYNWGLTFVSKQIEDQKTYLKIRSAFKKIKNEYSKNIKEMTDYLLDNITFNVGVGIKLTSHHQIVDYDVHYRLNSINGSYLINYYYPSLITDKVIEVLKLTPLTELEKNAQTLSKLSVFATNKILITTHTLDNKGAVVETDNELLSNLDLLEKKWKYQKPIISYQTKYQYNYKLNLDENIAKELFFQENNITGSISSFEKYFKCNYSYFMQKGLRLYSDQETEFNAITVGNIIHYVLSKLVEKYSVDYVNKSDEKEIKSLIAEAITFKNLYQYQKENYDLSLKQLYLHLKNNLVVLKIQEENSSYTPKFLEETFKTEIVIDDVTIKLTSIIDRVDSLNNDLVIKDYKTGSNSFSFVEFAHGLKLQLLTYMLVLKQTFPEKEINGVYYVPLANKSVSQKIKYGTTTGFQEVDEKDLILNEHKLNGLTFTSDIQKISEITTDTSQIKGLKIKKSGEINGTVNPEFLLTKLNEIYQLLIQKLRSGKIDINPIKNICKYCDYHSICQFNGIARSYSKKLPADISETEYFDQVQEGKYE